jgi:hypothetical protein
LQNHICKSQENRIISRTVVLIQVVVVVVAMTAATKNKKVTG